MIIPQPKKITRPLLLGVVGLVFVVAAISFIAFNIISRSQPTQAIAYASNWQAGRIIDDVRFYDNESMSVQDIQNFLNSRVPNCDTYGTQIYRGSTTNAQYATSVGWPGPAYVCLRDYYQVPRSDQNINNLTTNVVPSGAISAAQIIKNSADAYGVSPKALLVLLEKESLNLMKDNWPLPNQYRNPMGYGCPDTAPCDPQYEGFYNQMMNAGRQFKLYKTNAASYRYKADNTVAIKWSPDRLIGPNWVDVCGSSNVYIENLATAGLYNYTPYQPNQAALNNLYGTGDGCSAYGNRNFWRIYTDWFGTPWYIPTSNTTVSDGLYRLNVPSGKSLDISAAGTSNGSKVQIWDSNAGGGQDWEVKNLGDGYYTLRNPISNKYLDVSAAGVGNGTGVQIWDLTGSCAQKWAIVTNNDGYSLLSACSGRALDVSGDKTTTNGSGVQIWQKNSANGQKWQFVELGQLVPNGLYNLTVPGGKALDVSAVGSTDGTNVHIWEQNTSGAQDWLITSLGNGYYTLKNPISGKFLDAYQAGVNNGTNVEIWTGNNGCAQKWAIVNNGAGYSLLSACSSKALDVSGNFTNVNGSNVQIWDRASVDGQRWSITAVTQLVPNGLYRLTVPSGKSLDVSGVGTANATKVVIWDQNTSGAQDWQVTSVGNGYYTLRNPNSNKLLDVDAAGVLNGTRAQIWENNNTCAQKWLIVSNGSGYYLLSECSLKALDVSGSYTSINGTAVQIWNRVTADGQRWTFTPR